MSSGFQQDSVNSQSSATEAQDGNQQVSVISQCFAPEAQDVKLPGIDYFNQATVRQGGVSYDTENPNQYKVQILSYEQRARLADSLGRKALATDAKYAVVNCKTGEAGIHSADGGTIAIVSDGRDPLIPTVNPASARALGIGSACPAPLKP